VLYIFQNLSVFLELWVPNNVFNFQMWAYRTDVQDVPSMEHPDDQVIFLSSQGFD